MSRWIELASKSPSGKTLFVCRYCGQHAYAPDKACAKPPTTTRVSAAPTEPTYSKETCAEREEADAAWLCSELHASILWNAIPRARALAHQLLQVDREEQAAMMLREDRDHVMEYVCAFVAKRAQEIREGRFVNTPLSVYLALNESFEELRKQMQEK